MIDNNSEYTIKPEIAQFAQNQSFQKLMEQSVDDCSLKGEPAVWFSKTNDAAYAPKTEANSRNHTALNSNKGDLHPKRNSMQGLPIVPLALQ